MSTNKNNTKGSFKRGILLFFLYTILYLAMFFLIDYYGYYDINIYWLSILSVVLGLATAIGHIKAGGRNRIDDMADEL